jgi:6-phosphogluconolactonase
MIWDALLMMGKRDMTVLAAWPRAKALALVGTLVLAACDDSGQSYTGNTATAPPPPVGFSISGSVSGLAGSGLLLQLNGGNNTNVVINGTFTLGATLAPGSAYTVTIATQPIFPTQACQLSNGSGTATANVTNLTIVCTTTNPPPPPPPPATFTIGGTVSGLVGSGLVLQDNGGDSLPVSANGSFTFATALLTGAAYNVTVSTQPGTPAQSCRVTLGSGIVATTNIANVAVVCRKTGQFAYTANNGSNDVSGFKIDPTTGALTVIGGTPVPVGAAPAIVTTTSDGKFAYVAGDNGTTITAFAIDQTTGVLTPIAGSPFAVPFVNGQPFPGMAVDPSSKFLYMASMGDAQVAGFAINATTGALTAVPGSPFAAGVDSSGLPAFSPSGTFVYVTNQGPTGSVSGYAIDPNTGSLTPVPGSPFAAGNDPTWVSFTPNGKFAYVSNSGDNSVTAYSVDATGAFTAVGVPYVDGGQNPGDLTVDFNGTHLYVPDQNTNQISVYAINQTDGTLTIVAGSPFAAGPGPYLVNIEPTGRFAYVASGNGAGLYAYSIDAATGALTQLAGSPYVTGNFGSVSIDSSGQFAYESSFQDSTITAYTINAVTGVLTAIAGSQLPTGLAPISISLSPEPPGARD